MAERFGDGEIRDPQNLPDWQRRLHRRIMAAVRAERPIKRKDIDENGRVWPGLAKPPKPRKP